MLAGGAISSPLNTNIEFFLVVLTANFFTPNYPADVDETI